MMHGGSSATILPRVSTSIAKNATGFTRLSTQPAPQAGDRLAALKVALRHRHRHRHRPLQA